MYEGGSIVNSHILTYVLLAVRVGLCIYVCDTHIHVCILLSCDTHITFVSTLHLNPQGVNENIFSFLVTLPRVCLPPPIGQENIIISASALCPEVDETVDIR